VIPAAFARFLRSGVRRRGRAAHPTGAVFPVPRGLPSPATSSCQIEWIKRFSCRARGPRAGGKGRKGKAAGPSALQESPVPSNRVFLKFFTLALAFVVPLSSSHAQFAQLRETVVWPTLDRHQHTLTQQEFESRLPLYSPDGSIRDYLTFDEEKVTVYSDTAHTTPLWQLLWSIPEDQKRNRSPGFRFSRKALAPITGASPEKPLAGVTIALDPGHIGGAWASIEERRLVIGRNPPVQEGDMVLAVAQHLAPQLEAAGARVVWIRDSLEPVTPLRPADLQVEAMQAMAGLDARTLLRLPSANLLRTHALRANMLFYRGAEISARAARVRQYQPDVTLCIHYNAAPWGRFSRPRLFNANKLVVFVHGAYTRSELADEAQRYHLFRKLLEGSAPEEEAISAAVADSMAQGWGFRPENYSSWDVAAKAGPNPYVWARNLLANRLFDGPTVFIEGPYMNDRVMFKRMIAGDYEGEKEIGGKPVRSLHREFADYIARGVITHYSRQLGLPDKPEPSPPPAVQTASPEVPATENPAVTEAEPSPAAPAIPADEVVSPSD
jgi:N-acetylmuramoyl-L-alanine amidase